MIVKIASAVQSRFYFFHFSCISVCCGIFAPRTKKLDTPRRRHNCSCRIPEHCEFFGLNKGKVKLHQTCRSFLFPAADRWNGSEVLPLRVDSYQSRWCRSGAAMDLSSKTFQQQEISEQPDFCLVLQGKGFYWPSLPVCQGFLLPLITTISNITPPPSHTHTED